MKQGLQTIGLLGMTLFVLFVASCGSSNVGTLGTPQLDDRQGSGVKLGGFEVVRYDAAGKFDPALNNTLSLSIDESAGQRALVIDVNDDSLTSVVTLDVRFDAGRVHPVRADMGSLLGPSDKVIGASFLNYPGIAGVGQVAVGDYRPAALKGHFATVVFENGAMRTTSAANGPYSGNGVDRQFFDANATTADLPNFTHVEDGSGNSTVTWTGGWQRGDGNLDGLVTVQDLTPIGQNFGKHPSVNFAALRADYDGTDIVAVQDLSTIGMHFQEGTSDYSVELVDNSNATAPNTNAQTITWASRTTVNTPSDTPGEPSTSIDFWTQNFDAATLAAQDTDNDGFVRLFVTPLRATARGVEAFIDLPAGEGGTVTPNLIVTGAKVSMVNDGDSSETIMDAGNAQAQVNANGSYSFVVDSISGQYSSTAGAGNFDGDTNPFPADMVQAQYDAAFNAVSAQATWAVSQSGAAGFHFTSDWIKFGAASPITGNPGSGIIFPDDDPESDASAPEGGIAVTVPSNGTYPDNTSVKVTVPTNVVLNLSFDVVADPLALSLGGCLDTGLNNIDKLTTQIDSVCQFEITWGSGGVPADFTTCQLELLQSTQPTGLFTKVPSSAFVYTDGVAIDSLVGQQYNILDRGNGQYYVQIGVPGSLLTNGLWYVFRLNDGTIWDSINKGGGDGTSNGTSPLSTDPPVVGNVDFITVPDKVANVNQGGPSKLQVFYPNPKIRRNPRIIVNPFQGTSTEVDADAYADVLKGGTEEFPIQFITGGGSDNGVYPRLYMVKSSVEPKGSITFDDPNAEAAPILVGTEIQPNRLVIDIAALPGIDPGDPSAVTYGYRLFDKGKIALGTGDFAKSALGTGVSPLQGVAFGINAYNRTNQLNIADHDYSNKTVQGATVGSPIPDVLFVEWQGGRVFDPAAGFNNVYALVENADPNTAQGQAQMALELRIAGISTNDHYIGMHVMESADFYNGITSGILLSPFSYKVYLNYPGAPTNYAFTDQLLVGSMPSGG